MLKQLFGHRKGHWTWKMVTEFISPSFNTSRKILFHDSWGTIWPMCHDPTLLHMRHGMIDNLTQSKDFNQEWTSLRFKSVHPNYWIFFFFETPTIELLKEGKKKRLNYKLHFLTLFKIQLCLLTLLWFNLVFLRFVWIPLILLKQKNYYWKYCR